MGFINQLFPLITLLSEGAYVFFGWDREADQP